MCLWFCCALICWGSIQLGPELLRSAPAYNAPWESKRGLQNKFAFTNWNGNVGLVFWLSFIQNLSTSVKEGLAIKLTDLSWNMSKAPLEIGELSIGLKISCWTCLKGSSVCSKAWGYFSAEVTYFIVMNLCNLWYPKQNTTNRLNRLARPHSANTQLSTFQSKLLFLFLRYLRLY